MCTWGRLNIFACVLVDGLAVGCNQGGFHFLWCADVVVSSFSRCPMASCFTWNMSQVSS